MKKIIFEGQETNYSVTKDGKIFNDKTGRELKGTRTDYQRVQLVINGKLKTFLVHRLVATAFCENPNNYTIVDHINRDKFDNRAENLRWVTLSENSKNCEKQARKKDEYLTSEELADFKPLQENDNYLINEYGIVVNAKLKRICKGSLRNGYLRVYLGDKNHNVHRLVYSNFVGPIPPDCVIDHIDGNRTNNHYLNLRAVSQSQNMLNAYENGRRGQVEVIQFSADGEKVARFNSIKEAADAIGVTHAALKTATNYGTKSGGFYWLRLDSVTTMEEFVRLAPQEAKPYKSYNKTLFFEGNLYSRMSKHIIPKFEDEKGIYCYLSTASGSYKKEYF